MSLLRFAFSLFFVLGLLTFSSVQASQPGEKLRYLPVQDAGRIKPFDTFAREVLELVYGQQKFKFDREGESKKSIDAYVVVLTWMLTPDAWQDRPIFEVKNHQVKKFLGLDNEQKWFKGEQLFGNEKFTLLRQELQEKRESKEKLTPYFQALQRLENQFFIFREIASGRMLNIWPPQPAKDSPESTPVTHWVPVAELPPEPQAKFIEISRNFAAWIGGQTNSSSDMGELASKLDQSVEEFMALAQAHNPAEYAAGSKIPTEVNYNLVHPFRWSYISYLLAVVFFLMAWIAKKPLWSRLGWIFVSLGFVIHTLGFLVRIYLSGRAPVTNMYETVVWVAWGAVIFAFILERMYRFGFLMFVGSLLAMISLVIADTAPAVLDPSLQPLEAVLRSNYWLTVHVMTIVISYAAFLLALGLGNMSLVYYLKGEVQHRQKIKDLTLAIYRSIQIGVVFLAPGIILGGIWADYSWGRFWGWDPKETWALIALLGYLAVLHARIAGLLREFGMAATAIISFSLVVMAWYGVNFVLGAGLHSYGFGAGGLEYVGSVIGLQFLFVLYVYVFRRNSRPVAHS